MTQTMNVDIEKVSKKSNSLVVIANKMAITTQNHYTSAANFLKEVTAQQQEVNNAFDEIIKEAHNTHKKAIAKKKIYYQPLADIERLVKNKIGGFLAIQERKRREEIARREEAARKEREALAKKAEAAKNKGQKEKAAEIKEQIQESKISQPVVKNNVPKVAGISSREIWDFKTTDINKVPIAYLQVNATMVGQIARATKGKLKIEGIEFYKKISVASSGK